MAGLEEMIQKAAPGRNIGKPLMTALLALLASGALFKKGDAEHSRSTAYPSSPFFTPAIFVKHPSGYGFATLAAASREDIGSSPTCPSLARWFPILGDVVVENGKPADCLRSP
jgi:hypothetical protein